MTNPQQNERKIGAHVSAAGGIDKAVQRASDIGCNSVQIFSGSPRVWAKPPLENQPAEALWTEQERLSISPVFTHALYLVNLASDKEESRQKSIDSLTYEMQFDAKIKGAGIIVHLGSHQGRGWDSAKQDVVKAIATIIENSPDNATFLIENSAGQNGKLCSDLSEIRWLIDQVKSDQLGWCFDTCHAFNAGYLLSQKSKVTFDTEMKKFSTVESNVNSERIFADTTIDSLDLWKELKCIHVNDSRDPFASGKDRHENLGDGSIPMEDFATFLNLPQLTHIPLILEVPGLDGNGPDAENVKRLQKILE